MDIKKILEYVKNLPKLQTGILTEELKKIYPKRIRVFPVSLKYFKALIDEGYRLNTIKVVYDSINWTHGFNPINEHYSTIVFDKKRHSIICSCNHLMNVGLDELADKIEFYQQVELRVDVNFDGDYSKFEKEVSGSKAWNFMRNEILKFYSADEFDSILKSLKPNGRSEWHTDYVKELELKDPVNMFEIKEQFYDKMLIFNNCYYYDLNSAYLSELSKIFPKCSNRFKELYSMRKKKAYYKKYFNYFVGMMAHSTREGEAKYIDARKYIVGNINLRIENFLKKYECKIKNIVYINTDGVIVQCKEKLQNDSRELGEFKIEAEGTCKMIKQSNYTILKIGDEIKGNLFLRNRQYVNWKINTCPIVKKFKNVELNITEQEVTDFKQLNELILGE